MKENIIIDAELIIVEKELKDIINNNFNICCPKCHSQEYGIYPTGCYSVDNKIINEDIKWKCSECNEVWASGFIKEE